jgi:hypothetical protein
VHISGENVAKRDIAFGLGGVVTDKVTLRKVLY